MSSAQPAAIPALCSDPIRVEALAQYAILDTDPEPAFDDITRVIAHICNVPIAVINFVDQERQFFKSEIGLGVRQTALDVSICAHALLERDLMVVGDTALDARFANNPLVLGNPKLRFYAGALLRDPGGRALGTLCVLDYAPRELSECQLNSLAALARQVMIQLELRRMLREQAIVIEERELAKARLQKALEAKDQFLAELSHELRGPLNPVLMIASALEGDSRLPAEVIDDIQAIRRNVELEVRLIDDLLDLTRVSRGKVELRRQNVDIHDVLRQTLAMFHGDLSARGLAISSSFAARQASVHADPARLHQIFANLLRNAVKFSAEKGTIAVSTRDVGEGRVAISVADTGIGIEAGALEKVFHAYEQGDRSVTRRFGGLGLGLAISKGLVEMHRGTIVAESRGPGQGATFTVTLPAGESGVKTAILNPPAAPLARQSGQVSRRVLLVEDNEVTARVMARLLRQMSHDVQTAVSVESALNVAATRPFDLLISDVGLPDGSGLDLMRELKKQYGMVGIAVTGYGMEEDIRICHDAGFSLHLTKPISARQLEHAIRDASPSIDED